MTSGSRIMTGLHVTSKKTKAGLKWYVYAERGGECVHTAIGERPRITPAILDKAAEARRQARQAPQDTIAGLIASFKQSPEFTRLSDSTKRDYRRSLDRIQAKFGKAHIELFEDRRMRGQIVKWRDDWQHKPRTADKLTVMMGTLLQHGVQMGRLGVNVAHGIGTLHRADRAEMVWTEQDWQTIKPSPELLDALLLDSMTGLRLGDLVKLEWQHVGEKKIVFVTAKRKRRVAIPVFPELRSLLDRLAEKYGTEGTVLKNSRGKPWTASGLGGVFQKAKNGVDVHIHDLRGTYVTWLCVKGLTDDEIGRIVGWSPKDVAAMRARYVDEARVVVSIVERLSA